MKLKILHLILLIQFLLGVYSQVYPFLNNNGRRNKQQDNYNDNDDKDNENNCKDNVNEDEDDDTIFKNYNDKYSNDNNVEACIEYNKWLAQQKRCYNSEEEKIYRRQVFIDNYKKVKDHNCDQKYSYTLELNAFADIDEIEFNDRYLTKRIFETIDLTKEEDNEHDERARHEYNALADTNVCSLQKETCINPNIDAILFYLPPSCWDWRQQNAVTSVKNQGSCGSCWAFSVVGMAESVNKLRGHPLTRFAEQQLLDCCGPKGYYCQGCNGAWPIWAVNYSRAYGIVKDYQYPYIGYQSACKVNHKTHGFYFKARYYVFPISFFLRIAIRQQPISVCIDASKWSLYSNGIFNNCSSSKSATNHAAIAVGYTSQGYWIIKNSWGTGWGQAGYITISSGNTCGVLNYALRAY